MGVVWIGHEFEAVAPPHESGTQAASVMLAKQAQRHERNQAITDRLEQEGVDMLRQHLVESFEAKHVAAAIPEDRSTQERQDAAAVAVRLHEPRWQILSRYHAADAILVELRKSQRVHGWYLADSDLRLLADHLANVGHVARLKVWTGQIAVTAWDWTRAALGLLELSEEQ